mgnify:CR=1 FL=1
MRLGFLHVLGMLLLVFKWVNKVFLAFLSQLEKVICEVTFQCSAIRMDEFSLAMHLSILPHPFVNMLFLESFAG